MTPALCLALVMDVSGSVNAFNWSLQRDATAAALEQPAVQRAARDGLTVTVVTFATGASVVVPPSPPHYAAAMLREAQRDADAGWTNVTAGIRVGTDALLAQDCERRVLDISGDGEQNIPGDVRAEVARAVEAGVEINALPIAPSPEAGLVAWFRETITDPAGGFVIVADEVGFARAIARKISMEVAAR